MNARPFLPLAAVLAAALGLAACSHGDAAPTAASATPAPAYAAVARGRIDVEGGLVNLTMPREGVVAEVAAHEGDKVRKGQLLAALDTEPAKLAVSAAEAEQAQAQAQIKPLEGRLKAAQQHAKRLSDAAAAGAGDGQSADDAHTSAAQLEGELEGARANAALATQKLASARYELAQHSLRAPIAAEVVRRTVQPGASVSPQSGTAFVLLPEKSRIVRAELNESFVGIVHPGMVAQVVDDSGNDQTPIAAHVLRIGSVFSASTLEDDPMVRANSRAVDCVLVFDNPDGQAMRIGQRVLVRFMGDGKPSEGKPAN